MKLTGLTKQDYITRRLLCRDVVVQGNPRVYKALRDQLAAVLDELQRIEAGQKIDNDLMDTIDTHYFRNTVLICLRFEFETWKHAGALALRRRASLL